MSFAKGTKHTWSEKQLAARAKHKQRVKAIFTKEDPCETYITAPPVDRPGIDCLKRKVL